MQCMHKEKCKEFLALEEDQKPSKSQFLQSTISTHFSKLGDVKDKFKRKFVRWVVENSMPLTMCRSKSFSNMIQAANKLLEVLSYQILLSYLHSTKLSASIKMKAYFQGKHFAITTDHWTSSAQENYGSIILHLTHVFELKSFVLSCMKHKNGCSAIEMENQLASDLAQ